MSGVAVVQQPTEEDAVGYIAGPNPRDFHPSHHADTHYHLARQTSTQSLLHQSAQHAMRMTLSLGKDQPKYRYLWVTYTRKYRHK